MVQIGTILLTFILTGIVANWLVQSWQQRNWLGQQKFLGQEKEYVALKDLTSEVMALAGSRQYRTGRVLSAVSSLSEVMLDDRLKSYDEILLRWNEGLNSLYVRLALYADYDFTRRLEQVHNEFAAIGTRVEHLVRQRRLGQPLNQRTEFELQLKLNSLQGKLFTFNRDLLNEVENKRTLVYYGIKVKFSPTNLHLFTTWQLIKAVFIRDVDAHAVVRPTHDFGLPRGARR